jgi:hypothetical protein
MDCCLTCGFKFVSEPIPKADQHLFGGAKHFSLLTIFQFSYGPQCIACPNCYHIYPSSDPVMYIDINSTQFLKTCSTPKQVVETVFRISDTTPQLSSFFCKYTSIESQRASHFINQIND